MCGHVFLGNMGLQPLRQHQPLWRCSACGRQSQMPLDCCAQPAYDDARPNSMIVSSVGWLKQLLSGMPMRIRSWMVRNPESEVDSVVAQRELLPPLADEMMEPVSVFAPETEEGASYDDLVEESPDRVHELHVS